MTAKPADIGVPIPKFPGLYGPGSAVDLCSRQPATWPPRHLTEDQSEQLAEAAEAEFKRALDGYKGHMLLAILKDPTTVVPTPAYAAEGDRANHAAAQEAMGTLTNEVAVDLCKLLAACDRSDWLVANILSKAIIARIAEQYARRHVDADERAWMWTFLGPQFKEQAQ